MTIYNQKPEPLSDNDRELLSAYLDQQLEAEEQAHLEARLLVEPLLRAELEELRATVQIFQELQPMPLPRSFTLAADTVQQKRPWWQRGWWVWSGAGAVATLLLVFVVASTMSLGTQSASDSMPQAAQTPVSSPAIVAQAPDETTASAPPRSIIATSSITHGTPVWTQTSAVPERYATPLPSVAARSFIPRTSHVLPENPTLLSAEQTPPPGQQVILPTKPAAQPPAESASQGDSAAAARSNTLLLISTILTFLVLLSFLWFLWHNQQRKKNQ